MHIPVPISSAPSARNAPGASMRFLRAFLDRAALALEAYGRERRIAADINYLQSFDDRLLADIGLTRAGIESFVPDRLGSSGHAVWADTLLPASAVCDVRRSFLRP